MTWIVIRYHIQVVLLKVGMGGPDVPEMLGRAWIG